MKKGFTLIELLAVIIILAVIALITIPLVMNTIDDAKKGSFKDSAYGIISAAEQKQAKEALNNGGTLVAQAYDLMGNDLSYKGSKPKAGKAVVNKKGEVALEMNNGTLCITKGYKDKDVKISEVTNENPCDGSTLSEVEKYSVNYIVLETIKSSDKGNYTLYTSAEEGEQSTCYEIEGTEYEACYIVETDSRMYEEGERVTLKESSFVHRLTSSNELIEQTISYSYHCNSSYWDYELNSSTAKATRRQNYRYGWDYTMTLNPGSTRSESAILGFDTTHQDRLEESGYIILPSPNSFTMPGHDVFFWFRKESIGAC